MAGRAVVGGHAGRWPAGSRPAAWAASRKPSSAGAGSPAASRASCQIASGATPTPPPHSSAVRPSRGGAEARAERAEHPQAVARAERRQALGARADRLEQELQRAAGGAQHGEGPRQERPAVVPAPALRRGEHVELARVRRRPLGVGGREHDVGADLAARGDLQAPAPERRERALAAPRHAPAPAGAACAGRWTSCSDSTPSSPRRAAAIARAAARPPESVVRHGIPRGDRGAADLPAVGARARAGRRVDHEVDVAALDPVDDVRRALADLLELAGRDPHALDRLARAPRGDDAEAEVVQRLGDRDRARLVAVGHGDERRPAVGQRRAGRGLRLGERRREVARDAHHLAGRAHLRAEHRVGALEAVEGQHRLLDADVAGGHRVGGQREVRDALAEHDAAGHLRQRHADRLGHERHGARRARVGLDDVQAPVVHRVLDVQQPDDAEPERDPARLARG